MVERIPYSFLSMSPCNAVSIQTQLESITSVQDTMTSDKISRLIQEKQCFSLLVPSLRETSYLNKEFSRLSKAEVLFMEVENTRLSTQHFLRHNWAKEKCVTLFFSILFISLLTFLIQETIWLKE